MEGRSKPGIFLAEEWFFPSQSLPRWMSTCAENSIFGRYWCARSHLGNTLHAGHWGVIRR
jgi:hypothetical protein